MLRHRLGSLSFPRPVQSWTTIQALLKTFFISCISFSTAGDTRELKILALTSTDQDSDLEELWQLNSHAAPSQMEANGDNFEQQHHKSFFSGLCPGLGIHSKIFTPKLNLWTDQQNWVWKPHKIGSFTTFSLPSAAHRGHNTCTMQKTLLKIFWEPTRSEDGEEGGKIKKKVII